MRLLLRMYEEDDVWVVLNNVISVETKQVDGKGFCMVVAQELKELPKRGDSCTRLLEGLAHITYDIPVSKITRYKVDKEGDE